VRGSASSWQTLMYLVRIPHRKGHSIQRDVWLAETVAWFSVATSTVAPRVGPNGRDLKLLHATQIEQPGRIFVCGVLLLLSRTTISSATIQVAWAEDRALLGSNPSAVPGAKIGGRGDDLSPHPLRLSEIGTKAINPTSIPYLSSPFAELTHPIRGRRNMSFFSLTCATRLSPVCASRPLGRLRIPAAA